MIARARAMAGTAQSVRSRIDTAAAAAAASRAAAGEAMGAIRITVPYVKWRPQLDGSFRPRFEPGPKLRPLGFKARDLRHPDGRWFSIDEVVAWSKEREQPERARIREARAAGKRARPAKGPALVTVEHLFHLWWQSPRMAGVETIDGRRRVKAVAPRTLADYKAKAAILERDHPELWGSAVDALTSPILFGVYEEMWRDRGLATARGVLAVLSSCLTWGLKRGHVKLAVNPAKGLGMETPAPRIRAAEPAEIAALVAAADAIGRPEIGDLITLGVWTGQRQGDRLALVDRGLVDGRRVFVQSKTGAIVAVRETPALRDRLAAARQRRQDNQGSRSPLLCIDETTKQAWNEHTYRHEFARVRAAAVAGVKDEAGRWIVEPRPSVADFRDQDLRDTSVTWLARAGCTHAEIASITGHKLSTVTAILQHYLASHAEIADHAIGKLEGWHGENRA